MADDGGPLTLPSGDPQLLSGLAANLAYVARHGIDTVLAREGVEGLGLQDSWGGPAYQAAAAEAAAGARLSRQVCDRFDPVVAALTGYAGELANARRTIETLREQWQAADRLVIEAGQLPMAAADPAAGSQLLAAAASHRDRSREELLARYAACLGDLQAGEDHAAAVVSAALGEGAAAEAQRGMLLAELPLTGAAAHRERAAALVERALAGLDPDATRWSMSDLERVMLALADSGDDQTVAQLLMSRLGTEGLARVADALGVGPGESRSVDAADRHQALQVLARAFAVSVSEADPSDPVGAQVAADWQRGWVHELAAQPMAAITGQLGLLALAVGAPRPVLPGVGYLVETMRAVTTRSGPLRDRLEPQLTVYQGRTIPTLGPAPDPYRLLSTVLQQDPQLARRVLLAKGVHGDSVLHDLMVQRPVAAAGVSMPLTSSTALAQLMTHLYRPDTPPAAGDPLASEFLCCLGDANRAWWELQGRESVNADRHLDPFRVPAATLLTQDPGRVWEAIQPYPSDVETRARMQGVLGEIAKHTAPASEGTVAVPALGSVLVSLAAFEADRLGQAVAPATTVAASHPAAAAPGVQPTTAAPGPQPPTATVQAAQIRLGRVLGFTTESATAALVHAAAAQDVINTDDRAQVRLMLDLVGQVPLAKLPGGQAVSLLVYPAQRVVQATFEAAHPIGNAQRASLEGSAALVATGRLAEISAGEEVQRALGYGTAEMTVVSEAMLQSVNGGALLVNPTGPVPSRAP